MAAREKSIRLQVNVHITDQAETAPLQAYVFSAGGRAIGTAPVEKGSATVEVPADLDGQSAQVFLGPRTEKGLPAPSAERLVRLGAFRETARIQAKVPSVDLRLSGFHLPRWCLCVVRGRLVKRFTLPDGTKVERPVCNARVTICEVDPLPLIIERLPDPDLFRLRDELLERLRHHPIPIPIPEPDPVPFPRPGPGPDPAPFAAGALHARPADVAQVATASPVAALAGRELALGSLAVTASAASLRVQLRDLRDLIVRHVCELKVLWPFYRKHCFTTVYADHDGRFSTWFVYDCKDTPDLYFSVEQFQDGTWKSVYRPGIACGTHFNYDCGSEVVLNLPGAVSCDDSGVDPPPGVVRFVLPWAIASTPIWGSPGLAAPFGWVKPDGRVDYAAGGSVGTLHNAPFGATLNFRHDDSWLIPSSGIKYYRYSYRRLNAANPPNTGAEDASWTPIMAPLARGYRTEYNNGSLPTYESYPVGPDTFGGHMGLFEFKPQKPPAGGPTVAVREWTSSSIDETAASWDTTAPAPAISAANPGDDAGTFEVKIEVFNPSGAQVFPGASTFSFILRNLDGTTTRVALPGEQAGGAYVLRVHVDNNGSVADLPQPSIGGVSASDDCGFLRYEDGDSVLIRFQADHPNDEAVFGFGITRGSNGLPDVSTVAPYVETSAAAAPTPTGPYNQVGTHYQRSFTPVELVGTCVNAAFAASVSVVGKATDGDHRIGGTGYDDYRLIAFALAESEDDA